VKQALESTADTPAASLRQDLRQAESEVTLLRRQDAALFPLLQRFDRIHAGFEALEEAGVDLRAERTRWGTVGTQLQEGMARVLRHANEGVDGLRAERGKLNPSADRWWWYLDELSDQRRREIRRAAMRRLGIAAVVILALGALAYYLFRPDPTTWAKLRLLGDAEQALQEGRPTDAIDLYRQATEVDPTDPEAWLRLAPILEGMGDTAGAAAAFDAAKELFDDRALYELSVGRIYIEMRQPEKALPHALLATELSPDLAQAFFILAGAYEGLGEKEKALAALETTERLADAADDLTLVATVRVRMATLLQMVEFPGESQEAPSPPTPTP
jgi:tetratricopeptide (TPR) repeat protein